MRYYNSLVLSYIEKDHIHNFILKLPDRFQVESFMVYMQPASSY
jgi:hypothetical protein